MKPKQKQLKFVLDHLKSGESLTSVKAQCIYGIKSLSSRISELRKDDYNIISIPIGGGHVKYELDILMRGFTPDPKFAIKFDIEDDDNAPYEKEFFEFLKGKGDLDSFIKNSLKVNGDFTLSDDVINYIADAFTWMRTEEKSAYWCDLNSDWLSLYLNLKRSKANV
jgi:hypothetical protein